MIVKICVHYLYRDNGMPRESTVETLADVDDRKHAILAAFRWAINVWPMTRDVYKAYAVGAIKIWKIVPARPADNGHIMPETAGCIYEWKYDWSSPNRTPGEIYQEVYGLAEQVKALGKPISWVKKEG